MRSRHKQDALARSTALAGFIFFHGANNKATALDTINGSDALFEVRPLIPGIVDRSCNRPRKIAFDQAAARLRASGATALDVYQPFILV